MIDFYFYIWYNSLNIFKVVTFLKRKSIIALIVVFSILFGMFFCSFIVARVNHCDCTKEKCFICSHLDFFKGFFNLSLFMMTIYFVICKKIIGQNIFHKLNYSEFISQTLVLMKVKLSD